MIKTLVFLLFTLSFLKTFAVDIEQKNGDQPLKLKMIKMAATEVVAGSRVAITVEMDISSNFYVYEDKVKLFPLEPDGMVLGGLQMSPLVKFVDFSGREHQGMKNHVRFDFFAEIPNKLDTPLKHIVFDIEYVACTQKYCLSPTKMEVKFPVNISSKASVSSKSSMIEEQISKNLLFAFVLIFVFGFLTSLTPCVYPLIPITLAVIGARAAHSSRTQAFALSFVYVLGISVTYSLLGVVAAKTGALFGQALSYQPVVMAFVILFVLMALSIYGYFEIRIPHFVSKRLEKSGQGKGFGGAFTAGLVAGVVASPCVGPVLVGVLAYIAKTQNVYLGFGLLFTFAMGMGVLFMLLGTFSSFFKKLPRSGGWMDGVKFVLGTAMLGVSLYYLKPLLPENWFLICSVLMAVAALFIFIAKVYPKTDRKLIHQMPFVFCFLVVLSPMFTNFSLNTGLENSGKVALKNGWSYYSEEALAKAKEQGKPVIIDFFADWCAACVELDEKTFSKPEFINAAKDFVLLKVDASENFPELADLQKKYKVYGLPTIIFINKQGEMIEDLSLTGFEDIEPMLVRVNKIN
ncbi:protein-disulfide reductase DsbD [bacterium]|nr:protein-disulfide reductase DsbD [bacterium]